MSQTTLDLTGVGDRLAALKLGTAAADAAPVKLIRLVYASVARSGLDYAALTSILRSSEAHNEADGVTGILCFGNGFFLQALEGDRTVVNRTYARITADPRHEGCELLRYGRIAVRRYADWSMKLVGLDDPATAKRRDLVLRHSITKLFDPFKMTGARACNFLEELAELERTSE